MSASHPHWESESLFTSGDEYFRGLMRAIEGAKATVELETYIFENGVIANRMVDALIQAAARGLRVRMIVDVGARLGLPQTTCPH